jgi:hypothetical protein
VFACCGLTVIAGQQMGISASTALGERKSWLAGAIAGLDFILKKFNLLASLNLLEKICLHDNVGVRQNGVGSHLCGSTVPCAKCQRRVCVLVSHPRKSDRPPFSRGQSTKCQ